MLRVHVGIRDSEYEVFRNQFVRILGNEQPLPVNTYIHWNTYEDPMLDRIYTITLDTVIPMNLINFIVSQFDNFLVPLAGKDWDGVKLFITDIYDAPDYVAEDLTILDVEMKVNSEYFELRYPN